jgi:concanavalin A-like lectin/glucanase superfamily protein/PEP-CTERM motif-containing protein
MIGFMAVVKFRVQQMVPLAAVLGCLVATPALAATIANWDFEDGVAGQSFTPDGEPGGSGGSVDNVGGFLMRGWNVQYGPSWSDFVAPAGGNLSMRNNRQDGYTTNDDAAALNAWSPSTWTIETAVYLNTLGGWNTIIGRDGSSQAEPESDFYLTNNGIDDKFRINVDTVGGERWILDGDYAAEANRWYALAAMSDGATLSLWLDDGSGYAQIGSLDISAQSVADNALGQNGSNWTFGRGWYGGSFVDHIDGNMDNVRFSDEALAPENLIGIVPEPNTIALLGLGLCMLAGLRRKAD